MLTDFPVSGFLICYGPLFVMIAGFIAYAVITDANARRTYLRRMDKRAEDERPPLAPLEVTEPVRTETPAGLEVALLPDRDEDDKSSDAAMASGAAG
jgi:hypothetical protein